MSSLAAETPILVVVDVVLFLEPDEQKTYTIKIFGDYCEIKHQLNHSLPLEYVLPLVLHCMRLEKRTGFLAGALHVHSCTTLT